MSKTTRDPQTARANRLAEIVRTILSENVSLDLRIRAARQQVDALPKPDLTPRCEVRKCSGIGEYLITHTDGKPITVCDLHAARRKAELAREEKHRG